MVPKLCWQLEKWRLRAIGNGCCLVPLINIDCPRNTGMFTYALFLSVRSRLRTDGAIHDVE